MTMLNGNGYDTATRTSRLDENLKFNLRNRLMQVSTSDAGVCTYKPGFNDVSIAKEYGIEVAQVSHHRLKWCGRIHAPKPTKPEQLPLTAPTQVAGEEVKRTLDNIHLALVTQGKALNTIQAKLVALTERTSAVENLLVDALVNATPRVITDASKVL